MITEGLVSGHSVENTKLDVGQQGEQSINSVQEITTVEQENVSVAPLSGLSVKQDSKGTSEQAGTTSKRAPSSSKRLLAPSFFSKKS